jgi:ABC-type Na+ efflux pump permease subunit
MDKILLIISREYFTRIQKKSFWIASILTPLLITAIYAIPIWLSTREAEVKKIQILDESAFFQKEDLQSNTIQFDLLKGGDLNLYKSKLSGSNVDALVWIPKDILSNPKGLLIYSDKTLSLTLKSDIENIVQDKVRQLLMRNAGIEGKVYESTQVNIEGDTMTLSSSGTETNSNSGGVMILAGILGFLLYFTVLIYGSQVMNGVIEEKSSRIIEVIVSSVKPYQLMLGKILGVGLVGLTQFLLWILLTFAFSGAASIIYGEKFTGATSVTFDGTTSTFNVIDDGTIFAFTPQNSSGPASVIVTTPAGSNAGNALFTYIGEEEPPLPVPIITGINPNFGPIAGGTNVTISGQNLTGTTSIKFNNANLQNLVVVNSATITGLTPPGSTGTANLTIISPAGTNAAPGFFTYLGGTSGGGTGTLVVENFYPPDRETYQDPITGATSDTAPVAGSYYIKYAGSTLYGPLTRGSGNIQLYKSDGTLVQTLTAGQITIDNNVVGLPFSNRDFGTDYYILMEQGVVNYCSGFNSPISTPNIWNFNTPPYYVEPYNIASVPPQALPQIKPLVTNDSFNGYQMTLTYNSTIAAGSGNLYVYRASNNTLALTIPVSSVAIAGPVMVIPTFKDILQPGVSYYLTSDAGYVTSYVAIDCFFTTTSADALENIPFTMADQFALVNFIIDSSPFPFSDVRVNPQTYIGLEFNREVLFGQAGTISIYNASGTVYQAIDIKTNFNQNKTNELIWIANDQNAQTGNQNTVWINPTKDLTLDQTFYILATSGSVLSTVGDTWSGISGSDVVRFKIDPGPTATTTPISSVSRFIEMTFDRQIEPGTGEIAFIAGGVSLGSVDASDAAVTITSA